MNRSTLLDAGVDARRPELLWEDGERKFYKVWRNDAEGVPRARVAVLPAAEHPTPGIIGRLVNEYALREYIDGAWALRPLELLRGRGGAALVLEYQDGERLDRLLVRPLSIERFLRIAVALAHALARLHERGLVHKDVKPANIVVDATGDRVWLTGFGIATRLPRERQAPEPPELIAGTLSHMAPEQTGRMNRSIDARSDLYSLGVTLYQALVGSLPFTAVDPMEWVHCHIARQPAPPHARSKKIPSQVSAVVMRLLAKTPEQRYQTAAGAEHDLRRCLAGWEARRIIDAFPLGEVDTTDRLLIPERLYGRETETGALLAAFDEVAASGTPRLVLVRGAPGIGKSSVVNELHTALVARRGRFTAGKIDELTRDTPYAALVQAFTRVVRELLGASEAELSRARDGLRHALEPNGALAVELIPELKVIIGAQPAVPDLPASEAKARLHRTLRRLIGAIAGPEHPLALFLDDLQWLDAGTLDLLQDLLTQPDLRHLLVVGAYRDGEVDASHPLVRKLAAIRQGGGVVQEITLTRLAREDVAQLVADAFSCGVGRATPLARLVHQKTAGNPFFVHQFLHAVVEEGLIAFDPSAAAWRWDVATIQGSGYTENVADLMAAKLGRLSATTQDALQQLACLGTTAETSTLATVRGTSEAEVHADLWEARRSGLVVRSDDAYRFVHDRVREAAYSRIPEDQRAQAHLRIGRLLKGQTRSDGFEAAGFAVVDQLNRGSALITSRRERDELAALNLRAGKRAKKGGAYASALNYLSAGAELAGGGSRRRRVLLFELGLHLAECEFLSGRFPSAEARLLALAPIAAGPVERGAVACLLADVYVGLHRLDRSVEVCLECLGQAGLHIAVQPTDAQVRAAYDGVWSKLGDRSIEGIAELPLMTDAASCANLDVLAKIARCALTQMDMDLLSVILCAAVEICLDRGNCDSSCYAYGYFGVIAGWRFGDFDAGVRFGRMGHDLVERRGLRRYEALVRLTLANRLMPWATHVASCRDLIRSAFDLASGSGDRISAVSSRCVLVSNLLFGGDPLVEVEREAEAGLAFCQRVGLRDFVDAADTQSALIRNLRGLTRRFGSLDDDRFDEGRLEDHFANRPHVPVFECWYWIRRLQSRFLAGDYTAALESSARAEALLFSSPALLEAAEYEFYSALTHALACDSASADEQGRHREAMASHHARLELWARYCPDNFETRVALVAAEIARLEGRDADAMRLYEQAIRSALENGFVHHEALAAELAARFYAARGFDRIARAYIGDAWSCYLQWGADGKARQLEGQYPHLGSDGARVDSARTVQTPVEQLELGTVLKVLQVMSGAPNLDSVITAVMRLALEHAGAERGVLILLAGETFRIEAEAEVSGDGVKVALRQSDFTAGKLPESVLHYVIRTGETVLLHDAADDPSTGDDYLRRRRARSVLCMPLLEQNKLVGLIYLENNLAPGVFTPARMAVLKVLASGAAISLENARLYRDLQTREARVRRLVESNIIGIITWRAGGQILDANNAFLSIVGYDREDLVSGRVQWRDLTPPEWHERDTRRLTEILEAGSARALERELISRDGTRVPALVASASFGMGSDEGVSFVLDLTERKRAEQALRESERQSRLIVDSIPGLVSLLGPTGNLEFQNRQLLEYFGQTPEELKRWQMTDVVHPDDLPHVIEVFTRSIASGRSYSIRQRFRRWDGVYRWFDNSGVPLHDPEGRIVRWCVLLTDIDEQKRAEEAIRQREQELKLVIDTMPALAWSAGADGGADFFNQHYLDFVGLSAEQARGWGWTEAVHPEDLGGLAAVWQRILGTEVPGEAEARLRRHDGEYRWFLFRVNPQCDENGRVVRWYGINTDIEDRKRAEEALNGARSELAHVARIATVSALTASIAHEVNQPLSGIITNAATCLRMLDADPPNVDGARETAVRTIRDGRRASDVIVRLRALFSKGELTLEPVDLNEAIAEVVALSLGDLQRSRVVLRSELADGLAPVVGDRVQLQQVVLNLLRNAAEAMREVNDGARGLTIRTEQEDGDRVRVTVRDTGPGVDPHSIDKLFDAFYTTKRNGMGIGLSVSRSIVERHDGRLWVEPTDGPGATFAFSVPCRPRGDADTVSVPGTNTKV